MAQIQPFRGIRYATGPSPASVSGKLAPPYDVLDHADKAALLAGDPHNFVAIDLPHVPPKTAGPAEAYARAANDMTRWLAEGVLTRDPQPALYAYYQKYLHAGQEFTRRMFFARLRLEPFGAGCVFPHEQTFGGPKEDRLALTRATAANLSPIFALYEDAENVVAQRLSTATSAAADAMGTLDDVENRLWVVRDAETIASVASLMSDKAVYIADGHHRYGTAMLYRDELARGGALPADHPANFVLTVFCAMEDPGLQILPTHRVLPKTRVPTTLLREDSGTEIAHLLCNGPDDAIAALAKFGPQAVAMYDGAEDRYYMVRPRREDLLDALEPGHAEAWRRLGLAFLHSYLLERLVAPKLTGGVQPEIHYVKSARAAVDEARGAKSSVFLMQPTTMEELRAVCQAGDLMPQKSTFFFPKLASGLVVNPLSA